MNQDHLENLIDKNDMNHANKFTDSQRQKWADKNNLKKTCKSCGRIYENKRYKETDMCDDCCDAEDLELERAIEDDRLGRNW